MRAEFSDKSEESGLHRTHEPNPCQTTNTGTTRRRIVIGVAATKGWLKGEEVWVAVQIFGEQSPPVTAEAARPRSVTYASADSPGRPGKECQPPESSLLDAITKAKKELSGLSEQAVSLHKEIVAEESGRPSGIRARQLRQKVATYNEIVNDINGRRQALQLLISDYNQSVERYNACIRK